MTTVNQTSRQHRALELVRQRIKGWNGAINGDPLPAEYDHRADPDRKLAQALVEEANLRRKLRV